MLHARIADSEKISEKRLKSEELKIQAGKIASRQSSGSGGVSAQME